MPSRYNAVARARLTSSAWPCNAAVRVACWRSVSKLEAQSMPARISVAGCVSSLDQFQRRVATQSCPSSCPVAEPGSRHPHQVRLLTRLSGRERSPSQRFGTAASLVMPPAMSAGICTLGIQGTASATHESRGTSTGARPGTPQGSSTTRRSMPSSRCGARSRPGWPVSSNSCAFDLCQDSLSLPNPATVARSSSRSPPTMS